MNCSLQFKDSPDINISTDFKTHDYLFLFVEFSIHLLTSLPFTIIWIIPILPSKYLAGMDVSIVFIKEIGAWSPLKLGLRWTPYYRSYNNNTNTPTSYDTLMSPYAFIVLYSINFMILEVQTMYLDSFFFLNWGGRVICWYKHKYFREKTQKRS